MNKIDDDELNFDDLRKNINVEINQSKNIIYSDIISNGDKYLSEIKRKNNLNESKKDKHIKYILKNRKDYYTFDELNKYSYKDVLEIKELVEVEKKSKIVKFFKFLINPSD